MLHAAVISLFLRIVAGFIAWRINATTERRLFNLFQTIHTGATELWLHEDNILVRPGRHTLAVVQH